MTEKPLISCLCVTRKKVNLLQRAVKSYLTQTYPKKELLIVYENDDPETKQFVQKLSDPSIIGIEVDISQKLTLGGLRNLSIQECSGDYFCQWDDDDWYKNDRLEFQMDVIQKTGMPACIMAHWLVFNEETWKAFVSYMRLWEGSILCKKSIVDTGIKYSEIVKGEDTVFIDSLYRKRLLHPFIKPSLYIYVYHGKNTWDRAHWNKIFQYCMPLSENCNKIIKDILDDKYSAEASSDLLNKMELDTRALMLFLLEVYALRPDLQKAFPEVISKDYRRLIEWACGTIQKRWEDSHYSTLKPYGDQFESLLSIGEINDHSLDKWLHRYLRAFEQ